MRIIPGGFGVLLTCGAMLASLSTSVLAEEFHLNNGQTLRTTDDSNAAQICLAALESKEAIAIKAKELDMPRRQLKKVVCNDMSPTEFARAHREDIREWSIATVQ